MHTTSGGKTHLWHILFKCTNSEFSFSTKQIASMASKVALKFADKTFGYSSNHDGE